MRQWIKKSIAWYRGRSFRKFYSVEGFGDGTEYIEWYRDVATCVSEYGVRTKTGLQLSWLEGCVTQGVFVEKP